MTIEDLKELYDYSCWANRKIFEALAPLGEEEFARDVAGSYASVKNTMVHMLSAEWGWLAKCGGHPRDTNLKGEDFNSLHEVKTAFEKVERYVIEFLNELQESDFKRLVSYDTGAPEKRTMPIGELMFHVMNHNAHHRGQVALLIRMMGYAPGDFDILFYYAEQRGVVAW